MKNTFDIRLRRVLVLSPPELTQNSFSEGAKNQGWFFEFS